MVLTPSRNRTFTLLSHQFTLISAAYTSQGASRYPHYICSLGSSWHVCHRMSKPSPSQSARMTCIADCGSSANVASPRTSAADGAEAAGGPPRGGGGGPARQRPVVEGAERVAAADAGRRGLARREQGTREVRQGHVAGPGQAGQRHLDMNAASAGDLPVSGCAADKLTVSGQETSLGNCAPLGALWQPSPAFERSHTLCDDARTSNPQSHRHLRAFSGTCEPTTGARNAAKHVRHASTIVDWLADG